MNQKICFLGIIVLFICGCSIQQPYRVEEAERREMVIPDDAYHLSGQALTLLEANRYDQGELFYVEDDEQLTKLLQYAIDHHQQTVCYQSKAAIQLDAVSKRLSMLNPFDISLKQQDTTYTNRNDEVLYVSHQVQVEVTDERYEQAKAEAKRRIQEIITADMTTSEKIAAIHDNIVLSCEYAKESEAAAPDSSLFQASGVLLDQRGVCSGYSRAFMLMAQQADIAAVYVSSEEMNHGWNYVRDENGWRHIDITWDDPIPDQPNRLLTTFLTMKEPAFFEAGHVLSAAEKKQLQEITESFFSNHF